MAVAEVLGTESRAIATGPTSFSVNHGVGALGYGIDGSGFDIVSGEHIGCIWGSGGASGSGCGSRSRGTLGKCIGDNSAMPSEATRIQRLGIVEAHAISLSASHIHGSGGGGYRLSGCQSLSSLILGQVVETGCFISLNQLLWESDFGNLSCFAENTRFIRRDSLKHR